MVAKKKYKRQLFARRLFIALLIILPLILLVIIYTPTDSTYSVSAVTESVEFTTTDENNSKLILYNAKVYDENYNRIDNKDSSLLKSRFDIDSLSGFEGSFKIAVGSTTIVERIANGNLSIQISAADSLESAGYYYSYKDDEVLKKAEKLVEFYIDDVDERMKRGETIIIPVSGDVSIGRSVNYDAYGSSTGIVRSGQVTIISKDILNINMFESNTFDLNIGDQFRVEPDSGKAYGFIVVNENSAMSISYKKSGKKGIIVTPGPLDSNKGYVIKPNLLVRIVNDGFIKSISLSLTILLTITGLLPLFQRFYANEKNVKKKSKKEG